MNQSMHGVKHRRIVRETGAKRSHSAGEIAIRHLIDSIVVLVFRRQTCIVLSYRHTEIMISSRKTQGKLYGRINGISENLYRLSVLPYKEAARNCAADSSTRR